VAGVAGDFARGIGMAEAAIDEGRALGKLNELVKFTNSNN
jgi:anthranilate phosphoribosyltransferase